MVNTKSDPLLNHFLMLIKRSTDDHHSMIDALDFFNMALRYNKGTPPFTEFVTVLKHKKPILYRHLKQSIAQSSALHHVLSLETDYQLALKRLNITEAELS